MEKKKIDFKKILSIVGTVLVWCVVAFTVLVMIFTIISVTTVDKNDRNIFGFKFYIVQTDSMSPSENNKDMDVHFSAGDIVIIRNLTDEEKFNLKEGDIIAFISTNSDSYNKTITHMIRRAEYNKDGNFVGYVTFGTNTNTDDEAVVAPEYVLGQYAGVLPGLGNLFAFIKTVPGYMVCILVPFLLLILYNGVNVIRLFRKYKKEQTAKMEAEKAEIAAERKQNEDMLRELQALKEQLAKQNGGDIPPATTEDVSDT